MQRVDDQMIVVFDRSQPERGRYNQIRANVHGVQGLEKKLSVRLWFRPSDQAEYFPTRAGVTVPLSHVPDLLAAIAALVPEAVEAWLAGEVEGDENVEDG